MGFTNCFRPEERRHTLLLCRLLEIQRSDDSEHVPDTAHGRMYRFARRRYDILHTGCKLPILAGLNFSRRSRQDIVHVSPWVFRFTRMPYGLKNGPWTFQRAKDILLTKLKRKFFPPLFRRHCYIFVNARRTYQPCSTSSNASVAHWRDTKPEEVLLFINCIDCLGHVIRTGPFKVSTCTSDTILRLQHSTTVTELPPFLRLCKVFCLFVQNFARFAAPLTKKLRKGQLHTFDTISDDETTALKTLKAKLVEPTVLSLPRSQGDKTVDTDTCDEQIRCVRLHNLPDGADRPTWYWSSSLNHVGRAYYTTHRELFALTWAVLLLQANLEGSHFTIRTDHNAFEWLLNLTDWTGKLVRWRLRLSEFQFNVSHHAGTKHQAPDALLWLKTTGTDQMSIDDDTPVLCITPSNPPTPPHPLPRK